MSNGVEASHGYAELALAALRRLGLPATPRNFEAWYAHVEGRNPALSRDIQKCLGAGAEITQAQADGLYELHILRADLSRDVMDIVSRFEAEVNEVGDLLEATGESAQGRSRELAELSSRLRQSADLHPDVGVLLESVISVTKSVKEENYRLERRLAESADEVATLRHNVEHIQQEAMTDPLTGVKNRKTFDAAIERAIRQARDADAPMTLILCDVDHFKDFNDRWGHQTGDQVLRLVAEVMNANIKGQDVLARYGGEEFAIILPDTSLANGAMLADRIRGAVESRRLKKRRTEEDLGVVTMSMGVAALGPRDSAETLIERADECLYAAKRAGRNRVVDERAAPMRERRTG